MTFVLGVSSGIFGAVPEAERIQYTGLYKKAQQCVTKGVEFVQVDLESVAEFRDPDLKENMEKVKKLGITFGIHSETRAFGVEIAELDSAIETDYKFGHERMIEILEKSGEIGSKYVLIHSSESEPFLLLDRHLGPTLLVDFWGNPLRKFLETHTELIEWSMGGTIEQISEKILNLWLGKKKEERKKITENEVREVLNAQEFIWRELFHGRSLADRIRDIISSVIHSREINIGKNYEEMSGEEERVVETLVKNYITHSLQEMKRDLLDHIQSRSLSYGPERLAYWFIARYMEVTKDPLWEKIVNANMEYFAKVENKTPNQWKTEKKIGRFSIEDDVFRLLNYLWVPAISAKYIWGHFNQDKNPEKLYRDFKPILKKYNMPLVLETPMAHRGIEEWLRFPNPLQMYYLVKQIGPEYVQIAMDFEHMLSIKLDVEKVIDCLPSDGGKYVTVIHAGYPAPLAPAHIPIPLGSDQQVYLYKMYYNLKKKGFGEEAKDCYMVFERGGGPDPIQQSIIALRKIVEFLQKDIKPEDLHKYPEFFGLAVGEIASPERQLSIIQEHARDPLRGLIVIPEETYTSLGKAALEKGKRPEEWKKEELR